MIPGEKGQYGYVRLIEEKGKKAKKTPKHSTPISLDLHSLSAPPQSTSTVVGGAPRITTISSLEESQEGSEWAIKIGDAPPPTWGKKRSLSQGDTLEGDPKRQRVDSGYVFRFRRFPPLHLRVTLIPNILQRLLKLPCRSSVDHHARVREIAAAFQFTTNEVDAYYSRVDQDAERTRRRFEKARKLLDAMSDVE